MPDTPHPVKRRERRVAEGSGALVVRNTLVNALGSATGVIVTLLLTPILLSYLGASGFGVWTLATTLTVSAGYLSLTDLGAQQAAVRFIAEARSRRDLEAQRGIYSTTFVLFVVVACLVTPPLVALAPWLTDLFSIEGSLRDDAVRAFQIVAVSLVFDLPALAPRALLEGAQRFVATRVLDFARAVVLGGAMVAVVIGDGGIVGLAVAYLAVAAGTAVATALTVRLLEPAARLRLSTVTRARGRQLLSFGGALLLLRVTSVVYRQMDRVIIGVVLGVSLIAQYEIAYRIQAAAAIVLQLSSSALLPAAAFLHLERAKLRELYLRGTCYTLALTVPFTVAIMIFAGPLVVGWVGDEWASSAPLARLFVVWIAFSAMSTVGWTILVALGRMRELVILNVVWVLLNLGLSIALVYPLGVAGVIWGTVLSNVLLTIAYTRLFMQEFSVAWGELVRRTIRPNVPGFAIQLAVGIPLLLLLESIEALPAAVVAVTGCVVTYSASLVAFALLGLGAGERAHLAGVIGSAVGRSPRSRPAGQSTL